MPIPISSCRFIRLRDAPRYLAMGRHTFNQYVRPYVDPVPIGKNGIGFDRLDLDAWADYHKDSSGRPPTGRIPIWDANARQDSTIVEASGTLTKPYSDDAFAKALALSRSKRQKNT